MNYLKTFFFMLLASKVGGINHSKASSNSKNAGFTVYCEVDVSGMSSLPPSTGEWQMPPTKPITTKENTCKPAKWNESKVIQLRLHFTTTN
jgi:hypothetical protein